MRHHFDMQVWPGGAYPLGATYDGTGTNFALFSEVAHRVVLCLFDQAGCEWQVELPERDGFVWHGYLPESGRDNGTPIGCMVRTTAGRVAL